MLTLVAESVKADSNASNAPVHTPLPVFESYRLVSSLPCMIAAIASRVEANPSSAFHDAITSGVNTKLSDPFTGGSHRMMHNPFLSRSKVADKMSSNHLTK
jgi:hypothetical protein